MTHENVPLPRMPRFSVVNVCHVGTNFGVAPAAPDSTAAGGAYPAYGWIFPTANRLSITRYPLTASVLLSGRPIPLGGSPFAYWTASWAGTSPMKSMVMYGFAGAAGLYVGTVGGWVTPGVVYAGSFGGRYGLASRRRRTEWGRAIRGSTSFAGSGSNVVLEV
jgi:hypothetical protein